MVNMKKGIIAFIVIVIAALSFLAGEWYGRDGSDGSSSQAEREVLYYVDPMNPGFRSEEPGIAPCGMPLEPVYADAGDEQVSSALGEVSMSHGAVKISQARQQLIGVNVSPVEVKPMTYSLRLYGRIVPDETKIYRINASTDSWVRQLSDITTGSIVGKDQLLAEVLAPAFYNAQVTYLVAMDNLDRIRQQLGEEIRHQQTHLADNQIRVAVQALQNLGITDAQIEELANTRQAQPYLQVRSPVDGVVLSRNLTLYQWFKAGEEFFDIADIGRVWVYADVYEDEVMHIRPGMDVKVRHEQMGKTFDARVSQVLPLFDNLAKTLKVRLDVDNNHYDLRPDMFVDVEIPITMPPSLHLPADAVLDSGTKKIIYVEMSNSIFEPRSVETGWRLGRHIQITGGLMPGEKVLLSGNFLIDSESRMKTAAVDIQIETGKDPVCGMEVDKEQAGLSGRTAEYANMTFSFCSDWCKDTFEKEPETYIQRMKNRETQKGRPSVIAKSRSWLDFLEPVKGSHVMKKSGTYPGQKMKRTIGTPAGSPGVVDWDGPDPEGAAPRDWGGWGKFPGAQYLGQKQKTKKTSTKRRKVRGAGKDTPPEDKQENSVYAPASDKHPHPETKNDMQELPASDDPAPSAH
jgi:RND family efflux transporter MFP subunit